MLRLTYEIFMTWKFIQHRKKIKNTEYLLKIYEMQIDELRRKRNAKYYY